MKYCLKWNNRCTHLKDADEISIQYIEDKGLVDFMQKYADKRIILCVKSKGFKDTEIAKLAAIRKQYPDYRFTVGIDELNIPLALVLTQKEIPFYFQEPVQDWETFYWYTKDLKVSDVNICGALGFELPKVKRFLEKNGLETIIRATPNVMTSITENCPPLQTFFIRPNDIDLYDEYIDVIEFYGIEHQDTFYNIYAKEKQFIGKLNQVIYDFPLAIDNLGLTTLFGQRRISCGRECLSGGRCRRCMTMEEMSTPMGKYVRDKVKENLQKQESGDNETN